MCQTLNVHVTPTTGTVQYVYLKIPTYDNRSTNSRIVLKKRY